MQKRGNALIVDDDADILLAGRLLLRDHFENIITIQQPEKIEGLINQHRFDVVLLDMNFTRGATSGTEGFDWLRKIITHDPDAVIIDVHALRCVGARLAAVVRDLKLRGREVDAVRVLRIDPNL